MKKFYTFILVTIIGFTTLHAQGIAIGPQVGFIKTKDSDKSVIMPGVALRINLLGLKAESSVYYKREEFNNGDIKTTSYPIMLTAMLSLLPIVHGEAGIGWYNTKVEYSGLLAGLKSQTTNDVGYHVGAGVELPLGALLLTGDIRYVFLNLKLTNNTNYSELKNDFYVILIGAMFKF
jgi:hypothetical protein